MKITVTTSSATLSSLLTAADKKRINDYIAAKEAITLSIKNNESGQVTYIETLENTAATTTSYPITYGNSIQLVVEDMNGIESIVLIASASSDVRILANALTLTQ